MLYTRTCNSESISDNFFGVSTEESCFFRWKANADNGASVAQELQGACVGRFGSSSDDDLQGMSAVLHAFIGKSALLTTCAPFPVMRLTSAAVSFVSLKSMKAASSQREEVSITVMQTSVTQATHLRLLISRTFPSCCYRCRWQ